MKRETAIKNYRKFSAADGYILGFSYKGNIYAFYEKEIPPRYIIEDEESTKRGAGLKLRFRMTKKQKNLLIRKDKAFIIGDTSLFSFEKNKGIAFEKMIFERLNAPYGGPNNVPFWEKGDISIRGQEYQIKYEGGQITLYQTLENLKKRGRKNDNEKKAS